MQRRWVHVAMAAIAAGAASLAVAACSSPGAGPVPGRGALAPVAVRPPAAAPGMPAGNRPQTAPVKGPAAAPVLTADLAPAELPAELRAWADSQRTRSEPGYRSLTQGEATYIAVTGGLRPTGGYSIGVVAVNWPVLEVAVLPPAPGTLVLQATTNPTRYFKVTPPPDGEVQVTIRGSGR